MKVQLITNSTPFEFQTELNETLSSLKDYDIIDIKYSTTSSNVGSYRSSYVYSALIMYDETKYINVQDELSKGEIPNINKE